MKYESLPLLAGCLVIIAMTMSCGGKNSESNVDVPGKEKSTKSTALEMGADVLQDKAPLKKMNAYLDGFHFYNGNMKAQMEAHHYVSQLNEEFHQAIIFDGNGSDAKIMGIEYIVSERLFKQLDDEEKKLWHSHQYEVKSGSLIAPGIPDVAEHELMEKLVSTYGKTIHTWHTDQERELPVGAPMIMMAFTMDGQLDTSLLAARDLRFKISTKDKKQDRADIATPKLVPGSDAWQHGVFRQLIISNKHDSSMHK